MKKQASPRAAKSHQRWWEVPSMWPGSATSRVVPSVAAASGPSGVVSTRPRRYSAEYGTAIRPVSEPAPWDESAYSYSPVGSSGTAATQRFEAACSNFSAVDSPEAVEVSVPFSDSSGIGRPAASTGATSTWRWFAGERLGV